MKRRRDIARTLGATQKTTVIVVTVLVGFGLGFGLAHFMSGSIAYWGVVSGPFFITLRVAVPATLIAGTLGVASGYVLAKGRFPGRDLLETIGSLPIILTPTVMGF
jgi:ABC-type sulfate transport system permease component